MFTCSGIEGKKQIPDLAPMKAAAALAELATYVAHSKTLNVLKTTCFQDHNPESDALFGR